MKANETPSVSIQSKPSLPISKKNPRLLSRGPVLWAVDPFSASGTGARELVKAMQLFSGKSRSIRPISVVSPMDLSWPVEFFPGVQERIYTAAKESLAELQIDFSHLANPTVLVEPKSSNRRSAEKLANFASEQKAKIIGVSTNGRRGFNRLRLGSFTEALLAISTVPVLVMGPKSKSPFEIRRIFFPTDYSNSSHGLFKRVLTFANELDAEIALFHVRTMAPQILNVDRQWIATIWEQQEKEILAQSKIWKKEAEASGVHCRVEMDMTDLADLGARLVTGIRAHKTDIVVMGVRCRPGEQLLFGGNTRHVLAHADCPVLVLRSK